MNKYPLEDALRDVLFEVESEDVIDGILGDMFKLHEALSSQGNFFIVDPFPFLWFDATGTKFSQSVVGYCRECVQYWKSIRANYTTLYLLPHYIKDSLQSNKYVEINQAFIGDTVNDNIPGINELREFYSLIDDAKYRTNTDEIYTDLKNIYQLKNAVGNPGSANGMFAPSSFESELGNKANIKFCQQTLLDIKLYKGNLPGYEYINLMAKDFSTKKTTLKMEGPETPIKRYIYMLMKFAMENPEVAKQISQDTFAGRTNKSGNRDNARNIDLTNYKNQKLNPIASNAEYWKDTTAGKVYDELSKANGEGDRDDIATMNNLKHTFDRATVDADLEKVYNLKHLPKDILGLEDTEARYDSRKYEDPTREKIKGVAGIDIYNTNKEIDQLGDKIAELDQQLKNLDDSDTSTAAELLKTRQKYIDKQQKLQTTMDSLQVDKSEYRKNVSDAVEKKFGNNEKVKKAMEENPEQKTAEVLTADADEMKIAYGYFDKIVSNKNSYYYALKTSISFSS